MSVTNYAKITGVTMHLTEWLKIMSEDKSNKTKIQKKYKKHLEDYEKGKIDNDTETMEIVLNESIHDFDNKGNALTEAKVSDGIAAYAFWDETEEYNQHKVFVGICTLLNDTGCTVKERTRKEEILKNWLQERNIGYELEEHIFENY